MSYPMTYQRVLKRNGLDTGDYSGAPFKWQPQVNISPGTSTNERFFIVGRRIEAIVNQVRLTVGDLRRLEEDATDEKFLCQHIAQRTGVDADVVAAVLKEFLAY